MVDCEWVIKSLAKYHYERGDEVHSVYCKGFRTPPSFLDPDGKSYTPDIWLEGQRRLYFAEPVYSPARTFPRVRAFANDGRVSVMILVTCSGTEDEAAKAQDEIKKSGILIGAKPSILVFDWRELFVELGIPVT
jgi:hypothetical protein